ncbi:IS701 family transposase [Streptomyces morookaense]|uniref:IS701 family transposase n=1 Tax=Streptomyces morookaense TaxID=1970 RepID=UPI003F4CB702
MDAGPQEFAGRVSPRDHVDALCGLLLASVPRSDQRRWGEMYVRGLLLTEGRKTMKGISASFGTAAMQSLQQFISTSPWEWKPVRQALARYLDREIRPVAWIVEPMVVTKIGKHSVGVARQFAGDLGRVANCQQSAGIWLASEEISCPVDWQLALPPSWVVCAEQRRRAAIPDHAKAGTPVQCAVESVVEMARSWRLAPRPVVMAAAGDEFRGAVTTLLTHRIPFVLRVEEALPVIAADSMRPAVAEGCVLTAHRLAGSLRDQATAVEWRDFMCSRQRVTRVVGVRVGLSRPVRGTGNEAPLLLVAAWADTAGTRPTEFWLSNISHLPPSAVFRIARLKQRVSRDLRDVCEHVGARDFAGRSFRGWHHHTTLVSIAHAISVLSRAEHRMPGPASVARPLVGSSSRNPL